MPATHQLSSEFMHDLKNGILSPLLQEVRDDDTLLMGLRGTYITVYYRGGQLLKVTRDSDGYSLTFDSKYDTNSVLDGRLARHGCQDILKRRIRSIDDTAQVVSILSELKRLMDRHPQVKSGLEREFQQVTARINSRSKSSNSSHYFITDIEHKYDDARYDMLGVRWRRNLEHRDRKCLVPVLFEMKYGLDALAGTSGVIGHLKKTLDHLTNAAFLTGLRKNIEAQFSQLSQLDLIKYERGKSTEEFHTVVDHIQIVLVLAEYVPHSEKLMPILDECDKRIAEFNTPGLQVDLRFASASLCGYAMHECTMLTTEQVRLLLDTWKS
ncbi:hypothetical protein [Stenotrophomonas nitritireducens]|uniref:DUF4297 domain-containing protein n=2 Tax=Stenotrophomonas TaxID=40323 RepID=A0ABR5NHY2_9GAMM|nr:hypothetical protein [Stenotrophomonas nitritireducens]KRG56155.1 hypothetical protein ABB22_12340 [Stenotrophomonas nitritireducens]